MQLFTVDSWVHFYLIISMLVGRLGRRGTEMGRSHKTLAKGLLSLRPPSVLFKNNSCIIFEIMLQNVWWCLPTPVWRTFGPQSICIYGSSVAIWYIAYHGTLRIVRMKSPQLSRRQVCSTIFTAEKTTWCRFPWCRSTKILKRTRSFQNYRRSNERSVRLL